MPVLGLCALLRAVIGDLAGRRGRSLFAEGEMPSANSSATSRTLVSCGGLVIRDGGCSWTYRNDRSTVRACHTEEFTPTLRQEYSGW